ALPLSPLLSPLLTPPPPPLSLHDALPISHNIHSQIAAVRNKGYPLHAAREVPASITDHALAAGFSRAFEVSALVALLALIITIRSEEHTSELQSLTNLVCRLLLEKKTPTP